MKIAVIGSGIAGLSAAYLLSRKYDVTVFERNTYPGGHCNTVTVETSDGAINVDCGFMVFNHPHYPNLRRMLEELRVATFRSDVSFTVAKASKDQAFEFSSCFHWRHLFNLRHWRLRNQILRINEQVNLDLMEDFGEAITFHDYIALRKIPTEIIDLYLYPLLGAIWPMPLDQLLNLPIKSLLFFLEHHGLLKRSSKKEWYTISQGSKTYVKHLMRPLKDRIIHRPVVAVVRQTNGVLITTFKDGELQEHVFDQVVIATHADITSSILKTKTTLEDQLLNCFKYQENIGYLHQDTSLMPKNRKAWSSWNSLILDDDYHDNHLYVTYWMNPLQNISNQHPMFVTLNPPKEPEKYHKQFVYHHPIFNQSAQSAQMRLDEIQGKDRIWFCGSYFGHGFHEDALKSGIAVADSLGAEIRWR